MDGSSRHSVPAKEDFKAKMKSTIFIYVPIVGMLICLLMALVTILVGTAYCTWTSDFSSLGAFAHFIGKLLAIAIVLFAGLIVVLVLKCARATWRKM